jgi:hypothetical protein
MMYFDDRDVGLADSVDLSRPARIDGAIFAPGSSGPPRTSRRVDAMGQSPVSRSTPPAWLAAVPTALAAAVIALPALPAHAATHEATRFTVPSGSPDDNMQAAAKFALELDPNVEISYWDSQTGALSVSRIEGTSTRCVLRLSPDTGDALRPLGRFMDGRIDPRAQAMFAVAHEVGHCKMRGAFLSRPDGRAADASVFPWLAQEVAADAYGILSAERALGEQVPVRQAVIVSRMLTTAMYSDYAHATGHYLPDALSLCRRNRTDADAVGCAIDAAYFAVGNLVNDEQGAPYPIDSAPQLFFELGRNRISEIMRVYDDIAQYKAQFSGADLSRFAFIEVSHNGDRRYITAATGQQMDTTYRLADYYGFKTGELVTDDERNLTVLRIDGDDELDWLLTLGAVVRTEDGESLRKGGAGH